MAISISFLKLPFFSLLSLAVALSAAPFVAPHRFHVGENRAWSKPTGNHTESFNFWASKNRFLIGDTLYFEYRNDSVLLVNYTSYRDCIVSDPIAKFDNGSGGGTVFRLDRDGDFYFIGGDAEHCVKGQKLAVRVMDDDDDDDDDDDEGGTAPSPEGMESWNWGPPSLNSTVKTTLASYFATAIGGFLIVLYLLT